MNPPEAPPSSTDPAPTHAPFLGSTTAPSSTSFYTNVTEQDSYPTLHSILEQHNNDDTTGSSSDHHLLSSVIYDVLDSIEQIATLLRTTLVYVSGTNNEFGDVQLGVDLQADAILWHMARTSRVIDYAASEEDPVLRNVKTSSSSSSSSHGEHGGFAVCWDPLDGSSIVDNNWAVGTIIGVWPTGTSSGDDTKNDDGSSFFTSGTVTGRHQATSIMAMYGPRTTVLIALADGTYEFTFGCGTDQNHSNDTPSEIDRHDHHHTKKDAGTTTMESADDNDDSERRRRHGRTGQLWSCTRARMVLSPDTSCRIFSPANLRVTTELSWYQSIVQYYMNQRYTLRYTGGLVPDLYQQFTKGMGIYMNPVSQKSPAKLRLTFEVAPVALLIERAGGMTSDCSTGGTDSSSDTADISITSILDLPITSIDQRTAFCGGTANEVQRFHRMMFEGMHQDENA